MPTEFDRLRTAYRKMAQAGYRPAAPSDGCGNIDPDCPSDDATIDREAAQYALSFIKQENTRSFDIGVSKHPNRALVYMIEAARCYCGGNRELSRRLLGLALQELRVPDRH